MPRDHTCEVAGIPTAAPLASSSVSDEDDSPPSTLAVILAFLIMSVVFALTIAVLVR